MSMHVSWILVAVCWAAGAVVAFLVALKRGLIGFGTRRD